MWQPPATTPDHRPLHTKPPAVPGCPQEPLLVAAGSCCCGAIGTGRIARSSRSPDDNGSRDAYDADTRKKSRLLEASYRWPRTNYLHPIAMTAMNSVPAHDPRCMLVPMTLQKKL